MERLLEAAGNSFEEDGFCSTAAVVYKNAHRHVIVDEINDDKEVVKQKALKLARRIKPEAVIIVGEGWLAPMDEFYHPGIPLDWHPRRSEVLYASGRSADQSLMIVQPITRRGEDVFLDDPEYLDSYTSLFDDCKFSA